MPSRTNRFQKLVFAVKRHAAAGATVTESKILRNRRNNKGREVDIVIEGTQAGHNFVISIECVDYGRPATIEWVEQMAAKHQDLPTDKLILVSNAAFTKDALEEAEARGIETVTFRAIENSEDNDRLFGHLDKLMAKGFSLTPTKVTIRVPAFNELPQETVVTVPDNTIFDSTGSPTVSVYQVVHDLLSSDFVRNYVLENGDEAHKIFTLDLELPTDQNGSSIFFMEKKSPLILRPADRMRIECDCEISASPVAMQRGVLGPVKVAWGEAVTPGHSMFIVASYDSGQKMMSLMTLPDNGKQLAPKGRC